MFLSRVVLVILILCSCVGCDQVTKLAAKNYLEPSQSFSYANDIIRLQYAENTGAFLSVGSAFPQTTRFWVLTIPVAIILLVMLVFALTYGKLPPGPVIALTIIIGGGFGNLVDRLFNDGAVVDFMSIGMGNIRTGIFNFADVMILVGIGVLFLEMKRS